MMLVNADRQFKLILANYICSNLAKSPQKNHMQEVKGKIARARGA